MAERVGRCERGLNEQLRDRDDIGKSEQAALRVCARALDRAERDRDSKLVGDVSKIYLDLRRAAGLTAGEGSGAVADPFDAFVAGLSGAGVGNTADRG